MTGRETRRVLLVAHPGRPAAERTAHLVAARLQSAGMTVRAIEDEGKKLELPGVELVAAGPDAARGCELVIVLGGDGTLLRGAELARDDRDAAARRQPRPGRLPGGGGAGRPDSHRRAGRRSSVRGRGADDHRRRGLGRRAHRLRLGAERGDDREGGPGANARARRGGRRSPAVAVGLRRGRAAPPRPVRPRTPSPPVGPWCGPRSRRSSWCRSARMRCSPDRW